MHLTMVLNSYQSAMTIDIYKYISDFICDFVKSSFSFHLIFFKGFGIKSPQYSKLGEKLAIF